MVVGQAWIRSRTGVQMSIYFLISTNMTVLISFSVWDEHAWLYLAFLPACQRFLQNTKKFWGQDAMKGSRTKGPGRLSESSCLSFLTSLIVSKIILCLSQFRSLYLLLILWKTIKNSIFSTWLIKLWDRVKKFFQSKNSNWSKETAAKGFLLHNVSNFSAWKKFNTS